MRKMLTVCNNVIKVYLYIVKKGNKNSTYIILYLFYIYIYYTDKIVVIKPNIDDIMSIYNI